MSRRWLWAFTLLGLANGMLFLVALWRDYDRDWKRYQTAFFALEGRKAQTAREEASVKSRRHEFIQVAVAGSTRIDRCMMCHLGAEDPRFADAAQPFRTHPAIPPHPFEKFGCTVCHQGQGVATSTRDAHGDVPFWDEPMLRGPYLQAACGACHAGRDLQKAPLLARGRQLYQERGCTACHRIRGAGGSLGPDLSLVGNRRRDPAWHLKHFRNPQTTSPGSTMPPFAGLPEEDLRALTVFMLSLRGAPGPLVASTPLPPAPPAAGTFAQPAASRPPEPKATPPTGRAVASPPTADAGGAAGGSTLLARAQALYAQRGCPACHAIGGTGGKVGPDLTTEGSRPGRDLDWHLKHFRNPAGVVPGSIMPPLADLPEDDLRLLAEYMLSLK
jgi:mono/diheme cytochrome c family protein